MMRLKTAAHNAWFYTRKFTKLFLLWLGIALLKTGRFCDYLSDKITLEDQGKIL